MPRERCHRCHTILTSEDKHFHGISCHTCEEDAWYAEHFEYVPLHAIWRYARYQVRWLRCATAAGLGICLRPLLRRLDARRQLQNARRDR